MSVLHGQWHLMGAGRTANDKQRNEEDARQPQACHCLLFLLLTQMLSCRQWCAQSVECTMPCVI